MKVESRLSRLIFVSPWPLAIFLIIPFLVILSVTLDVRIFFLGSTRPLLINNIVFAILVGFRLFRHLLGFKADIRYGAGSRRSGNPEILQLSLDEAKGRLRNSGYFFDGAGNYGEKHDPGYAGTIIMYLGLFLLLAVGSWDNLRQFSGALLDGMGPATNLNKLESYRSFTRGPFAAVPKALPRMQITNQILPDSSYPMGATDLTLLPEDGKPRNLRLVPRIPVRVGDYDIYMAKLVFEPQIVIKRKDTEQPLFNAIVTLNPLVQKRGVYSFYGLFQGYDVGGGVYYQPEKSNLMIVVTRGDKKVVSDMVFQVDQQVTQGDYIISCARMGQWSEIHVVHRRHKGLLMLGGITALLGLLLRIAIRPQRVWLEETAEGCRVWGKKVSEIR